MPADQRWQILETGLWFAGAILLGALIMLLFQRWQKRAKDTGDSIHDQLSRFREMYEAGEMSEEEYRRVHSLLAENLQKTEKPAPPAPPGSSESLKRDSPEN